MKSDKLALIEGKFLNLMFFDINIPVIPIEIWLQVTQSETKNSQSRFSLIIPRLKTKSWLKCSFSLLNFQMWPGILRDKAKTKKTSAYLHFL